MRKLTKNDYTDLGQGFFLFIIWGAIVSSLFEYVLHSNSNTPHSNVLAASAFFFLLLAAPVYLASSYLSEKENIAARILTFLLRLVLVILIVLAFYAMSQTNSGYCATNFSDCYDW